MNEIFEDDGLYLKHHGIKGQAWGVRNGPPYPLGTAGKEAFSKIKKLLSNEVRSSRNKQISAKKFNTQLVKAKSANNTADANYIKTKAKKLDAKNEYQRARHRGKMDREQEKLEKERMATERAHLQGERLKEYQNTIRSLNLNITGPTEAFKQRIINSGDKKLLKKYGYLLNNDEYADAMNRLTLQKEIKKGKVNDEHRRMNEGLKNVRDTLDVGVDLYNRGVGAYNAFVPDEQKLAQISKEVQRPKTQQELLNEKAARVKIDKINNIMSKINNGTASDAERETLNNIIGVQGGKKKTAEEELRENAAKARSAYVERVSDKARNGTASSSEIRAMNDILGISNPKSQKDSFVDKLFDKATTSTGDIDLNRLSPEERQIMAAVLGLKNQNGGAP